MNEKKVEVFCNIIKHCIPYFFSILIFLVLLRILGCDSSVLNRSIIQYGNVKIDVPADVDSVEFTFADFVTTKTNLLTKVVLVRDVKFSEDKFDVLQNLLNSHNTEITRKIDALIDVIQKLKANCHAKNGKDASTGGK